MVPRARRSPGLASYPPSPPRSALTGASSGSRSWSSSARDGAAGSLFRKRVAVSAGGRSLYEIGRDSGGAAFFGTPPPVPLLGQREGDPAGVGLCVRRRGFFVPLFQGGFSMTNRPFCEIPAMQCPVCGQAARVLVCEEARPPVLADVVFCYHCASVLVLQADLTPRLLTPVEVELALRAHPVLLTMTAASAKYNWARG